jgi:hypothetical protein
MYAQFLLSGMHAHLIDTLQNMRSLVEDDLATHILAAQGYNGHISR